jgi:hypothetical protein
MSQIAERLQKAVASLAELQQQRIETGDPHFGHDVEEAIIQTELRDLEADMAFDSGIQKAELVRVRRRRKP